ncbi:undecaprenyl/decaprenyl-phosphate alpha-N-acetylglucosaminyl 1-phosphate transferase [Rubripirellula amarantea]|uniref:WecA-like glycosyltransferase n=1 Tax=Rubripirellula amarantea TaxID=2527999 RepID=A0A5C5WLY3_9BACT|nr:MraY family glycosyltransferase [Rubripirellula amarantea]MDA8744602.1 undecaprenyl/decaprenyl-phosphate alpha-N-acetylglucosaminyl 1-phosphate transferase [Rubripirellula amarantea]TWT51091.1 WecA-like glycosyltransferase [Rubripirellula amarantea]
MGDLSSWTGWLLAATIVPPLLISALSLYPVRKYAGRLGLMAKFGGHSTHTNVTPLGGGIGIWLGVMVTFALGTLAVWYLKGSSEWQERLPEAISIHFNGVWSRVADLWKLLAAGSVLVALGFTDDRRGVNEWLRLAVEFAVAAYVVYGLGLGFTAFIEVAWLTNLLSMIWIVGLINSFNMLDNMDGLSGGVAAIIAASMAMVMLTTPDPGSARPQLFVAGLLLVVLGSLLGFLFHNRPPAKIFMGDAGSYFVGFLIAVSMLMATYAGNVGERPHAVLAPLCVMAVPFYDMTTVIWIRIRERRSIFKGDRSHFSHRLVDLGLSRTQAVLTIYLVTGTCGLAAVLLTLVSVTQAIMVFGIVLCMLLLVIILESTGWQKDE